MPSIPNPVVISAQSYALYNAIRDNASELFKQNTPIVTDEETRRAYGLFATGAGFNEFTEVYGTTFQSIITTRNFHNSYAKFKAGLLTFGESVRDIFVNMPIGKGYTLRPDNPAEILAYNNTGVEVVWHPVNFRMRYDTSITRYELKMCFNSPTGLYDLTAVQIRRLYDKFEIDERLMTRYTMAKAILENWNTNKIELRRGLDDTKAGAQAVLSKMQEVSNDIIETRVDYTALHNPWHSPKDKQTFWLNSKATAQIGVYAMAEAFNLSYDMFASNAEIMATFSFTPYELEQIDQIGSELKDNGYMPDYKPFTKAQLAQLERVVGVIADREFFKIFDVELEVETFPNPGTKAINYFLHASRVFSYNPFVNLIVFTAPAYVEEVDVQALAPAEEIDGYTASDLQTDIIIADNAISGNLAYISTGDLATEYGAGNFLALKLDNFDPRATSVKIGASPSTNAFIEMIDSETKTVAIPISSTTQRLVVQTTTETGTIKVQTYNLSGLLLAVE